ncbi:hypothetical protein [Candidatus Contubernalis alkaliaceticus]|uniref:hypothetical protein n=1 Tax=Candidatus Contubernalis alkaliaceticus TaxID=338645 RepID=UPI001F4C075F|nr:hypothetical protein [Candidatus Contubernalis alkalaceticus]UNC92772.1 hypothetical protein HUE98_12085 [Candidatus Contubernalis alkalaceticus]
MSNEKKRILTREQFIKGSLAGLVLVGGAGALLTGCSETAESDSPPANTNNNNNNNNSEIAAAAWPFTYQKLDPDKAEELAFQSYLDGHG